MQVQSEEQQLDENEERISQSDGLSLENEQPVIKIETSRLILRKPCRHDVDAISNLANNEAVATMLSSMPHPYTKHDAEEFVGKIEAGNLGNYVYAITNKQTGEIMGGCGIKQANEQMEIGYWLGEPYWGKGYATEAAHALVDLAFQTLGANQLIGSCRIGNLGSRRILQKCGFQFSGTGVGQCLALHADMPIELYKLDKQIWASLKNWPPANQEANQTPTDQQQT